MCIKLGLSRSLDYQGVMIFIYNQSEVDLRAHPKHARGLPELKMLRAETLDIVLQNIKRWGINSLS